MILTIGSCLLVTIIVIATGIVLYKMGISDGYEECVKDGLFKTDEWIKNYKDLLVRYDELEEKYKSDHSELLKVNRKFKKLKADYEVANSEWKRLAKEFDDGLNNTKG